MPPLRPFRRTPAGGITSAAESNRLARQVEAARRHAVDPQGPLNSMDVGLGQGLVSVVPPEFWLVLLAGPDADGAYDWEEQTETDPNVWEHLADTGEGTQATFPAYEVNDAPCIADGRTRYRGRIHPGGWVEFRTGVPGIQSSISDPSSGSGTGDNIYDITICETTLTFDCCAADGQGVFTIEDCWTTNIKGPVNTYNTVKNYGDWYFYGPPFFIGPTPPVFGNLRPITLVTCVWLDQLYREVLLTGTEYILSSSNVELFSEPFTLPARTWAGIRLAIEWDGAGTATMGDEYSVTLTIFDSSLDAVYVATDGFSWRPIAATERGLRFYEWAFHLDQEANWLTAGDYTAEVTARRVAGSGNAAVRTQTKLIIDVRPVAQVETTTLHLPASFPVSTPDCEYQDEACCTLPPVPTPPADCDIQCGDCPDAPSGWLFEGDGLGFVDAYAAFNVDILVRYVGGCVWKAELTPVGNVGGTILALYVGGEMQAVLSPSVNGVQGTQSLTYTKAIGNLDCARNYTLAADDALTTGSPPDTRPDNVNLSLSVDPDCESPDLPPDCVLDCPVCPLGLPDVFRILFKGGQFVNPIGGSQNWSQFTGGSQYSPNAVDPVTGGSSRGFDLRHVSGCVWRWSDPLGTGARMILGLAGQTATLTVFGDAASFVTYQGPAVCDGEMTLTRLAGAENNPPKDAPPVASVAADPEACGDGSGSGSGSGEELCCDCAYSVRAELDWSAYTPPTPASFNCVQGVCIDPGDGTGTYAFAADCLAACQSPTPTPTPTPSYNCTGGDCVDPGDGTGTYSTYKDCWDACSPPPRTCCPGGATSIPEYLLLRIPQPPGGIVDEDCEDCFKLAGDHLLQHNGLDFGGSCTWHGVARDEHEPICNGTPRTVSLTISAYRDLDDNWHLSVVINVAEGSTISQSLYAATTVPLCNPGDVATLSYSHHAGNYTACSGMPDEVTVEVPLSHSPNAQTVIYPDFDLYAVAGTDPTCYAGRLSAGGLTLNHDAHPGCQATPAAPEVIYGEFTESQSFRFWYAAHSTCAPSNARATTRTVTVENQGTCTLLVDSNVVYPGDSAIFEDDIPYTGYNQGDASAYLGGLRIDVECVTSCDDQSGSGSGDGEPDELCLALRLCDQSGSGGATVDSDCCDVAPEVFTVDYETELPFLGNGSVDLRYVPETGNSWVSDPFTFSCDTTLNPICPPGIEPCTTIEGWYRWELTCETPGGVINWRLVLRVTGECVPVSSPPVYPATGSITTDFSQIVTSGTEDPLCPPFEFDTMAMSGSTCWPCFPDEVAVAAVAGASGIWGSGSGDDTDPDCQDDVICLRKVGTLNGHAVYAGDYYLPSQASRRLTLSNTGAGDDEWVLAAGGGSSTNADDSSQPVDQLTWTCTHLLSDECGLVTFETSSGDACCALSGSGSGNPPPDCCGEDEVPDTATVTIPAPPGDFTNGTCDGCTDWPGLYVLSLVPGSCMWAAGNVVISGSGCGTYILIVEVQGNLVTFEIRKALAPGASSGPLIARYAGTALDPDHPCRSLGLNYVTDNGECSNWPAAIHLVFS